MERLKQKPKPDVGPDQVAVQCWKCSGTGFFCLGLMNGAPYSRTGFVCYPCGGTGWRIRRKPRRKKAAAEGGE